jgi:Cu(I)/Ag(I) efflux system membrane protein CusA/SilA
VSAAAIAAVIRANMIRKLIEFSIRYRSGVVLAAVVFVIAGLYAAIHSPMDAVPDLSENQVIVFSSWPGHGPREVEEQVTYPLSLQLQGLDGIRVVRGSSDVGYSMLHVIFADGVSFSGARRRVQERLASLEAGLPDGVVPHLAADGIPTGQIFWYTVEGTGFDLARLRSLQDWTIAPQLRSIPGVAEVASVGGFVSELQIDVEPNLLAQFGLTIHDLNAELSRPTGSVGGHVLHKGNAEFVVQLNSPAQPDQQLDDWRHRRIPVPGGRSLRLGEIATIKWGPAVRRGMFEKDGSEAVAGIVHIRYGHNVLDVTKQVRRRLHELAAGLPAGVRVIPVYDRTPLITGAVGTVSRALIEALLVAAVCVLLVLRHVRAWLVIAFTLPLSVLGTFLAMTLLRSAGWVDIQTNIMSLSGMVISIGVLIDSSIVMTENVMHQLRRRFGDRPVSGDVTDTVAQACQTVGWPVFCSILVMLISFAPVFALSGIDGRMYQPLAWTKSLALICAALLSVMLVPALCVYLVRGRIRDESESSVVRSVISVYRPMLSWLLDSPGPLVFLLCVTLILAAIPLGSDLVFRAVLFGSLVIGVGLSVMAGRFVKGILGGLVMILIALAGQQWMRPIGVEMRMPLDEGMVMDMPITIPRASITQSADDLKERNMILCRFPEVSMVTGKAGRADTPFDPAPLDMIETMIEFRPRDHWPRRRLLPADAAKMTGPFLDKLVAAKLIDSLPAEARHELIDAALFRYDAIQRETAFQFTEVFYNRAQYDLCRFLIGQAWAELRSMGHTNRELSSGDTSAIISQIPVSKMHDLVASPSAESLSAIWPHLVPSSDRQDLSGVAGEAGHSSPVGTFSLANTVRAAFGIEPSTMESRLLNSVQAEHLRLWQIHVADLNRRLHQRAARTWFRLVADECYLRGKIIDPALAAVYSQIYSARTATAKPDAPKTHHGPPVVELPFIDPHPVFDAIVRQCAEESLKSLLLWPHDPTSLAAFGGEMDRVLQMPGWTNVWTKPIQNRVDMLATGVNAEVGVRVLGRNLDEVVQTSEQIAAVLKDVTGAADVVADPVRGKGLIQVTPNARQASQMGVSLADLQTVLETSLSGRIVGQILDGQERKAVRVRIASPSVETDDETLRRLPVPCRPDYADPQTNGVNPAHPDQASTSMGDLSPPSGRVMKTVPLETVAEIRVAEGPATIKSENGWLRNYVRLNVRDRNPFEFVEDARRAVASGVTLPQGVFVEWTGQFEHALRTRRTLCLLVPAVLLIIFAMLYLTYRDTADAMLMLLSAPGALAGGVLCQWLLGYKFSIAVGVGYIACFGMAAATGIVMLVYLREAVEQAGGLERMSLGELKQAVLNGAVHRLRPKLLTEATTILGLAPMLWSDGIGAEVIRPMAAPVLGGILIADEVIDLLIPVLFYHVRRRRWLHLHGDEKGGLNKV